MGILSKLFGKRPNHPRIVTVAFRDIEAKDPLKNFSPDYGYAYVWPFPEEPRVGDWAIAPGISGPATVIVGDLGMPDQARGTTLKALTKRIPTEEVAAAWARRDAQAHRWLDYARHLAGLPLDQPPVTSPPDGFDALPPAEGQATPEEADRYGRAWWRAYGLAGELGRPAEEVAAFKAVGKGWFKIRDDAAADERDRTLARTAASIDMRAAVGQVRNRPGAEVEQMLFSGHPLWDWLEYAKTIERQGQIDEALAVLEVLIAAAEHEASLSGREPAPAYTERAAIIHRRRRDYGAEIAVLERWERACPPERRGHGAKQAKLLARLERARELAAKG